MRVLLHRSLIAFLIISLRHRPVSIIILIRLLKHNVKSLPRSVILLHSTVVTPQQQKTLVFRKPNLNGEM